MDDYSFWRERESRFLELAQDKKNALIIFDGAYLLHAIQVQVDLPSLLKESSQRKLAAMANPNATMESVYGHARTCGRAGRILLSGEQADRWIVSGGPVDDVTRATLHNNFRAEAALAAAGADVAD